MIGQLEEFARRVSEGLREPDWLTRREIIRALVKQVEIDEEEVRIVYRVSPSPFEGGPQQGSSQHCWGRDYSTLRRPLLGSSDLGSTVFVGLDDGTFQPHADQLQHRAVGDPSLQTLDQCIMRDRVEVRFQIRVIDLPKPGGRRADGSRRSPDERSVLDETQRSSPGSPPQRSARAPARPPFERSGL